MVVGFKISGRPLTLEISSPTIETDESPGEYTTYRQEMIFYQCDELEASD